MQNKVIIMKIIKHFRKLLSKNDKNSICKEIKIYESNANVWCLDNAYSKCIYKHQVLCIKKSFFIFFTNTLILNHERCCSNP